MLKYILAIFVFLDYTLAVQKHNPQVYEVEESLLEIPREAKQHGDKYQPHVFIYNKTSQLDFKKLRYYQQQKVDLRNSQIILKRLQSEGRSHKDQILGTDRDHNISETGRIPVRRRRVVRPKFAIVSQNGFLIDRLIEMQAKYGKKEINRAPRIRIKEDVYRKNRSRNENSEDDNVAVEDDLEVAGSELGEVRTQVDKQAEISAILSKALVSNPQPIYVQSINVANTLGKGPSSTVINDSSYVENNQKENDALYLLLEKSITEAGSSERYPSSQSLTQISQAAEPHSTTAGIQIGQTNILKSNGQDLEQIQAELDAISRKKGERALAEAQRSALEYVKSQKNAIERAEAEATNLAIATINAHNSQLTRALPQNIPSTQPHLAVKQQQALNILPEQQGSLQLATSNNEEVKKYDEIPIQIYSQLAAHGTTAKPLGDVSKNLLTTIPNEYSLIYPEINYSASNGVKNIDQNFKIENVPLTKLLTEAYEKSGAKKYSQVAEDLQKEQLQSESRSSREKAVQNGYDVKYAPNYAFGYRVMDYHSGIDYGHEESRDGDETKGKYHVLLPDGRIQNVNYWANPSGYHAKVSYSGVAEH